MALSPEQEFPIPDSAASGKGSFTVNLASGPVSGSVTVGGFTPTADHIRNG